MIQQPFTLPSIPSASLSKLPSNSTAKFKKLPFLKDDNLTQREYQKSSLLQQHPSKSLPKRNLSSISLATTSERKEMKKQKLMMNLIEKKIKENRYDENEEVATDLNNLKGQHSDYTTKVNTIEIEIAKLRQRLSDVRGEKQLILGDKLDLNNKLNKIKRQTELWKQKNQQAQYEKAVNMNILERQTFDYKLIQAKCRHLKEDMGKKKIKERALDKKEVDLFDKEKLTERRYQDLMKSTTLQSSKIKQMLNQKQKSVQMRAINEIERWDRKRDLIEISETVIAQQSQKAFNKHYHQILGHLFLSHLMGEKFQKLIQKNQRMIDLFNQASNTYGPLTPEQYPSRYQNSQIQRNSIKQNIKKLQKLQQQSEIKNKKLQQKLNDMKTDYLEMGLQLQKQYNQMNFEKTISQNSSKLLYEKIFNIQLWLQSCLEKLSDYGLENQEIHQSSQSRLSKILEVIKHNLLQQKQQ